MPGPRERFSATAELYARWRPSYPDALVSWIVSTTRLESGALVADLGCGTGISTRLFAQRGFRAVGVDPNEAMLARARAAGGAFYVRAGAEATGLASGVAALAVVAQAFHWFDVDPALEELSRVLRAGGWCAAFWNARSVETGLMAEYDALLRRQSSEYPILESHESTLRRLEGHPRVEDGTVATFPFAQRLDLEGLLGRAFSSSYVVHGVGDRPAFEKALRGLFERHAREGAVEFRYRTTGLCFRIA
jgi:SAM-dependent methyltransferase